MYVLYWEAGSGAIAPQVMLEEMGLDYSKVHVDMSEDAHRAAEYRQICPTARVPALGLEDGSAIGETAAIALLLGERHPETGLVPAPGDPDRAEFLFWLTAMAAGGYPVFSRACHPEQFTEDDRANDTVRAVAEGHLREFFDVLEGAISGQPFFLPRGYTALDIYLAMLAEWVPSKADLFASRPKLEKLCTAVNQRPAYARVAIDHGLSGERVPQDAVLQQGSAANHG